MNSKPILDIHSKGEYPGNALSNFYPHRFIFDGVECASMEGFLQSLKTKNIKRQRIVCQLCGVTAKKRFSHRPQNLIWKLTGNLYWQGRKIKRDSLEYQSLIDSAYEAMMSSESFVQALKASKGYELRHSIGHHDIRKTVLTEEEFIQRLNGCRKKALELY